MLGYCKFYEDRSGHDVVHVVQVTGSDADEEEGIVQHLAQLLPATVCLHLLYRGREVLYLVCQWDVQSVVLQTTFCD